MQYSKVHSGEAKEVQGNGIKRGFYETALFTFKATSKTQSSSSDPSHSALSASAMTRAHFDF